MEYVWPIVTCALMFICFWVGRLKGFVHGHEDGFRTGVEEVSPVITKAILEWVRTQKDVHISDPEIQEVITSTVIKYDY